METWQWFLLVNCLEISVFLGVVRFAYQLGEIRGSADGWIRAWHGKDQSNCSCEAAREYVKSNASSQASYRGSGYIKSDENGLRVPLPRSPKA
jgi:hypothetical protein